MNHLDEDIDMTKTTLSVLRAAEKAWFAVEREHRRAVEIALATKRELERLDAIIESFEPPKQAA